MKLLHKPFSFILFFSILISACSHPPLGEEERINDGDYSYQIGPGDLVNIFVWDNPDISSIVTVRPDGKITTPMAEDLLVSGKTPNQVARELEGLFKDFIRDPQVVVMVSEFQGVDSQQIRIVGQLGNSGGGGNNQSSGGGGNNQSSGGGNIQSTPQYQGVSIPYERGMTLLDVIIRIGSIGRFADGNRASIIRKINGVERTFGVKIDDLIDDGDMSENVAMLPGDILIIPSAFF